MTFKHIDIIGLGGTGSQLIENLVRFCLYSDKVEEGLTITLVDGDLIEDKNLARGFFSKGVGQFKTEFIRSYLVDIYGSELEDKNILIDSNTSYIGKNLYLEMLSEREEEGTTLAVLCVDNDDSRREIIEAIDASDLDIIYISPGNDKIKRQVTCWAPGINYHPKEQYQQLNDTDPTLNPGTCAYESVSSPQLLVTNMMAACVTLAQISFIIEENAFREFQGFNILENKDSGKIYKLNDEE
jgi:molybdopterin/thiamine biosynthesis adenylyltransferase